MPTLTIQTLLPDPYVSSRNTDYATGRDFKVLGAARGIEFRPARGLGVVGPLNAAALTEAAFNRLPGGRRALFSDSWLRARRWVRVGRRAQRGAQLLYSNFALPSTKPALPFVLEADFYAYGCDPELRDATERMLKLPESAIDHATAVIVRCVESEAAFARLYPKQVGKTRVIPWYMPYAEAVSEQTLAEKWSDTTPPRFLFTGNQAKRKGLVQLLEALQRLRDDGRKFQLTVVTNFKDGHVDIPDWADLRSDIPRPEVQKLMAQAHFFLLPTFHDAHPKVMTEALAAGCVLLAPSHDPLGQIFGPYGRTADPRSVPELVRAIDDFAREPQSFAELGMRNRATFLERFHHEPVGARYASLFRAVANGETPPP